MDCIFCQLKTQFLYENKFLYIIKDKFPKSKFHFLVIPKAHIETLDMVEDYSIIEKIFKAAKQFVKENGFNGYKIAVNVNEQGGQEIFHLHFHLHAYF